MFLSGHETITTEVLEEILPSYFDDPVMENDDTRRRKLFDGVNYPDLPCGKYKISDDQHVTMHVQRVCPIYKLYRILSSRRYVLTELHQSHRGIFAFYHSMSFDPELKVKDVVNTIIINLASCAFLAIYDDEYYKYDKKGIAPHPNIFWIGFMLHVIQDSFSQSHTIRYDKKHKRVRYTEPREESNHLKARINRYIISLSLLDMTEKELKEKVLKQFKGNEEYVRDHMYKIFKAYKMYAFEKQRNKLVMKLLQTKCKPTKASQEYDIKNFQFYNNQSGTYHRRYDFLEEVRKESKMYERMKKECADVLILYQQCLRDIAERPKQHGDIAVNFVKNIFGYLQRNTFRISADHWEQRTGMRFTH